MSSEPEAFDSTLPQPVDPLETESPVSGLQAKDAGALVARRGEPPNGIPLSRSRVLIVMGSYFVLTSVLQAFIPLRASSLGANGTTLGVLLLLTGGGIGLVTDMGFAAYADARGRDRVVFGGLTCALLAACLLALNSSLVALFVGCFVLGISNSMVFNSLSALLTTTQHHHTQARTQGFNGSVQRFGALLAALMVGLTLASRHDELLAITAIAACLSSLLVMTGRMSSPWNPGPPAIRDVDEKVRDLLKQGYRLGVNMFRRRKIVLAALLSISLNLIFVETNSFVPLLDSHHGLRQALVITLALIARDLVAITVGIFIAVTGRDVSSPKLIVSVLILAALCAVGVGIDTRGTHQTLILCCALQGVAVGVGVAATNLLAVVGSSDSNRSVAMAASNLMSRVGGVVIPMSLGLTLQLLGLNFVFFTIGGALAIISLAFAGIGFELDRPRQGLLLSREPS